MSFNWQDFLKIAEELMNTSEEAKLRTATSRAYYAVFCPARNKKGYKGYKKGDIHQKVISLYKRSNIQDESFIGKTLDELRRERNDADYDENKKITQQLVQRAVLRAKNILKKL